jgi:hypothetical protein
MARPQCDTPLVVVVVGGFLQGTKLTLKETKPPSERQ